MHRPVDLNARCGECLLYGAIQGMADGLVLVDPEGRIFHLNRRAQQILDLSSRHVLGTRLESALHHPGLATFWASALRETAPVAADLSFPAGVIIHATVSVCLSAGREPLGRALLLRDVTQEKKIRIELTDSVARRLVRMSGQEEASEALAPLTPREREVLRLLAEGLTNAQIAERIHVSVNTVASHLKNLYPKIRVNSRAQAAAYAVSHGIRPPPR